MQQQPQPQPQTQMILVSSRNYFNKRNLCKIAKSPNRVQRGAAEAKKSTNMPASTAKTTDSERSYRISNRRRSCDNHDLVYGSINCATGTIRTANCQGSGGNSSNKSHNNNGYDPSVADCKSYARRRRTTITSGKIMLTLLLSTALLLEANSSLAAPTEATTILSMEPKDIAAMKTVPFLT
ncbi:PREDICTED: uncharacterized protein LOC108362284 [Rhagoletis zephyria]|uniref:uncharacterized protein LOC108362284 n=1 Tax=Rhagoletis zephyria TaxID=28612 RepID=UPI000811295F|nr:PREDICTED: uncharacterized protein LOC108362284 [Rhagoletis zephyria]